jgi:predicted transcriptional regulator
MSDTQVGSKLRSVRIPLELDARLVAEAERLDRSVSWLIVRALDGSIGRASQKVATQRAKAAENPAAKMTPEELDPYFDAIQEQVKPTPEKRSEYEWKDLPPSPNLEQFKCSVCGLRTVGGPCQKHPKSSEKVA